MDKELLRRNERSLLTDLWTDIAPMSSSSERTFRMHALKLLASLDRIIKASSIEGDLVLDPYCGCALTVEAALRLNGRWIEIDIVIHAIKRVARVR